MTLGKFIFRCLGREDWFKSVGVITGIPRLGTDGHGSRSKVLNLFKLEVQSLGLYGKVSHIFLMTSGMGGDEVRNELLTQSLFFVYLVKDTLKLFKKLEGRFSHQLQNGIGGVLRCYLQSAADVIADKLTGIFPCRLVGFLILTVMKQQVVSHARAYEALLNLWQGINRAVDVEQGRMVGVKVGADLRIDARRTLALGTSLQVTSVHSIHIGRRPPKIREIALEIWEFNDFLHLPHDTLL